MQVKIILFWVFSCLTASHFSQTDIPISKEIEPLFMVPIRTSSPGGSVLIARDGDIIFSKDYGFSNIEHRISNTKATVYNVGSIAKQFTALGILLLEAEGKLLIEDSINSYLPDFPDFGFKITIRQLLQHTSGLRDSHGLLALAGWKKGDIESQTDILRILRQQKELNFVPESEFLYSNSGYILLARIIENITLMPFAKWMEDFIFKPLGMFHTKVYQRNKFSIPSMANSYSLKGTKYVKQLEYWDYYGSGNVYSNAIDLHIWLQNFSNPKGPWYPLFLKLQTNSYLSTGQYTNYGMGVRTIDIHGRKSISHGGSIGGFRSAVIVFPEDKIHIVILSNYNAINMSNKIRELCDILFPNRPEIRSVSPISPNEKIYPVTVSKKQLQKYEGIYWSSSEKIGRKVYFKNDTLRYVGGSKNIFPLVPIGLHTFRMLKSKDMPEVMFYPNSKRMVIRYRDMAHGNFSLCQKDFQIVFPNPTELVGDYYSKELHSCYTISESNSRLYIHHVKHGIMELQQLYNDIFSSYWPVNIVEIERSESGDIQGILISNGRTRNVSFKKLPSIEAK
ncbi:serine hydrolase [Tenacibaculum sp. SG-28]|uniref:serine hydrolase domain-containing protein n=1 Tax=Tenacibaculum sp. SG-28 TaxID=754426 RepID=UPI000CF49495|nr:serine hydrolase domain-containing protein [Tenacibaculum sp. SG-28]PQJ19644.1 hypothetical protein BSU00_11695 [Tenacibaculum sp. SG-28]